MLLSTFLKAEEGGEATSKTYAQYVKLFNDFDLARRMLAPLKALSEEIVIEEDDSEPSGLRFENILEYNKLGAKKNAEAISNLLAKSLDESWNLLADLPFTVEREGDVILEPQVPPASKKTRQDLGEVQSKDGKETRQAGEKERKIRLKPELNLTKIVNDIKEVASKTYDNEDLEGKPLTFEKALIYLYHKRTGEVPRNAKNPKLRDATITNARKKIKEKLKEAEKQKKDDYDKVFEGKDRAEKVKFNVVYNRMQNYVIKVGLIEEQLQKTIKESNERVAALEREAEKPEYEKVILRRVSEILRQRYKTPRQDISEDLPPQQRLEEESLRERQDLKKPSVAITGREYATKVKQIKELNQIALEFKNNPDSLSKKAKTLKAQIDIEVQEAIEQEREKNLEIKNTAEDALRFVPRVRELEEFFKQGSDYPTLNEVNAEIKITDRFIEQEEDKEEQDQDKNALRDFKKDLADLKKFHEAQNNLQKKLSRALTSLKDIVPIERKMKEMLSNYSADEEFKSAIEQLGIAVALESTKDMKMFPDLQPLLQDKEEKTLKEMLGGTELAPLLEDKEAFKILEQFDEFIQAVDNLDDGFSGLEEDFEELAGKYSKIKSLFE